MSRNLDTICCFSASPKLSNCRGNIYERIIWFHSQTHHSNWLKIAGKLVICCSLWLFFKRYQRKSILSFFFYFTSNPSSACTAFVLSKQSKQLVLIVPDWNLQITNNFYLYSALVNQKQTELALVLGNQWNFCIHVLRYFLQGALLSP